MSGFNHTVSVGFVGHLTSQVESKKLGLESVRGKTDSQKSLDFIELEGISGFVLEFPIRVTVDSSEPLKTVLRNVHLGNLYTQSGFNVFVRVLLDYYNP